MLFCFVLSFWRKSWAKKDKSVFNSSLESGPPTDQAAAAHWSAECAPQTSCVDGKIETQALLTQLSSNRGVANTSECDATMFPWVILTNLFVVKLNSKIHFVWLCDPFFVTTIFNMNRQSVLQQLILCVIFTNQVRIVTLTFSMLRLTLFFFSLFFCHRSYFRLRTELLQGYIL